MAQHVKELMAEPVTVAADTTLTEAARLMRDADIGDVAIEKDVKSALADISAADPDS